MIPVFEQWVDSFVIREQIWNAATAVSALAWFQNKYCEVFGIFCQPSYNCCEYCLSKQSCAWNGSWRRVYPNSRKCSRYFPKKLADNIFV